MKRLALVTAVLASTIAAVDASAVNVALPAISRELGGGLAGQQWVSNSYLLTLSALILLAGSLTDLFGERRLFLIGVAGFGVASLLCALAPTVGVLIGARALQGVFGAVLTPAALAIIVAVFPRRERGAAVGSWTAWGGIGLLLGPLVGGQIVDSLSWRWIFLLNVPLVLVAIALAVRAVPEGRTDAGPRPRIDVVGALLTAAGLAGVSFALIEQPLRGWGDPAIFGPGLAGLLMLAAFVAYERRVAAPMLPLGLFARRNFSIVNAQSLAMYGGLGVLTFLLTLYLQQVAGFSALKAGSTSLVPTVVMFLLSPRVGRLADRLGPRRFLTVGPFVTAAGFLLFLRVGTEVSLLADVVPAMLVLALGLSITVSPLTATVLADADESDAGIASATNNAVARTAGLIGVAAVGAIVAASYAGSLDARLADGSLPASAEPAVQRAKTRTFSPVRLQEGTAEQRASAARAGDVAARDAFHLACVSAAGLLAAAGLLGLAVRDPRREDVECADCPGGQFTGAPTRLGATDGRSIPAPVGATPSAPSTDT